VFRRISANYVIFSMILDGNLVVNINLEAYIQINGIYIFFIMSLLLSILTALTADLAKNNQLYKLGLNYIKKSKIYEIDFTVIFDMLKIENSLEFGLFRLRYPGSEWLSEWLFLKCQ